MPEQAVTLLYLPVQHKISQDVGVLGVSSQLERPPQDRAAHEHIFGAEIWIAGLGSAPLSVGLKSIRGLDHKVVVAGFAGGVGQFVRPDHRR